MLLRNLALAAFLSLGLAVVGLALAGPADADPTPPHPAVTNACDKVGDTMWKHGEEYRCVHPGGSTCNVWKWVYNPDTPKSGRTAWPRPSCPCTSASPTGSPSPSPTPAASASIANSSPTSTPTVAPSVPAIQVVGGGTLPVTGPPVGGLVALGGSALGVGLLAIRAGRAWRRRTTGNPS